MNRSKGFGHHIILLPIVLLVQLTIIDAGASSTPKNLVNIYSSNDSLNVTSSNQFQNEYQFRQTASKAVSSDRYKSPASSMQDSTFDHMSGDLSNPSTLDYSYQDNRAMTNVPDCKGRIKLNGTRGYIIDGSGYYQTNLQCIWLVDSGRENATIRIQLHQFNTECNYDFLYIFDGDSIYSPLVAALSGDMKDFSTVFVEPKLESMISSIDNQTNSMNNTPNIAETINANLQPTTYESRTIEIKTYSGKAFIYFHSDTAQSMSGFYITYSINSCSFDCSNRGECDYLTLTCKCNSGYHGEACEYVTCPNNCTSLEHGTCDSEKSCICREGYFGVDCSLNFSQLTWTKMPHLEPSINPKAFHHAVVVDDVMWIIGGRSQSLSNANMGIFRHKRTQMIISYDLKHRNWTDVVLEGTMGEDHLAEVTGHSIASHGNKIFIYGGIAMNNTILDALTVFDTKTRTLSSIPNSKKSKHLDDFVAPIASVGHSANIIDGYMYVFLGYNPLYGYLNVVQKMNLANNSWSFVEKKGSSIAGCIGHTSSYDSVSKLVYLYGGHSNVRSKRLYSFDSRTEIWTLLQSGPSSRYYHSSLIIDRQLVVIGGISYNTSSQSDQCFQQNYLVYDLSCTDSQPNFPDERNTTASGHVCGRKCWQAIDDHNSGILKRHGHSVVNLGDELVLYGGFNGIILSDIRSYKLKTCDLISNEVDCRRSKPLTTCVWDGSKCMNEPLNKAVISKSESSNCTKNDIKALQIVCETRETCTDCLSTSLGCVWCGVVSQCQYNKCKSSMSKAILESELCYREDTLLSDSSSKNSSTKNSSISNHEADIELECKTDNCYLCQSKPQCTWQGEVCSFSAPNAVPITASLNSDEATSESPPNNPLFNSRPQTLTNSSKFVQGKLEPPNRSFLAALTTSLLNPYNTCDVPCYMRRSCNECTTTRCIWCSTSEQCIDSSAYFAYNTMGQCMHYVAHMLKCPVASCSEIETCDKCLTNPKCGWLNDISNTGKGRCIEGNSNGPSFGNLYTQENAASPSTATMFSNWFYTSCPSCQCNGHSYCKSNSSICVQSCQDSTEGPHCDRCIPGYYGDPINGGSCRPCRCNGHAQTCNRETGKCYCSTKGIIGHNCNRCDDKNYYIGDPSIPGNGTCYYNLTTDYQYTFNMSKPEDHFYNDINFINVPLRKDSDVDFTIACSRLALVNISAGFSYKNRRPIHSSLECGSFRLRFSHDRHALTDANYSFFVHVYKFQTPFILQIAFSQHRTLYLPQFFFTFSSCFLFFFALFGVFWKLKHEYDLYIRRQRQFIEMEQMASRPFSTILLEMSRSSRLKSSDEYTRPLVEPTPISFEPCFGNSVGVLSLFVQLPGKPNLAIGSALISLNDDTNCLQDDDNPGKRSEKSVHQ